MSRGRSLAATIVAVLALGATSWTGCGSDGGNSREDAAVARYRAYLEERTATLAEWSRELMTEIEAGKLTRAQSRYASSRVPLGQLAPFLALFPDLEASLDAGAGEVPPDELSGFHRIERALFANHTTEGLSSVTRRLLGDVEDLGRKVRAAALEQPELAAAIAEVLAGLSASEVRGKEQPNAHIDLVDLSAKIEGADAAFEAIQPAVAEADPKLAKEVERGLQSAYRGASNFGIPAREPDQPREDAPGVTFVLYGERTAAEYKELDRRIKELRALLPEAVAELEG